MVLLPRIFPLVAPVLRRVLGPSSPEIDVLQPAETVAVTPPACLPGMLQRAAATVEGNELSYYLEVAAETSVTHAPALRMIYRNAIVRRKGFATPRSNEKLGPGRDLAELLGPITQVQTLRYCYDDVTRLYFGHWLTDAVSSALIDPDRGVLWMPPILGSTHSQDYLDALDLQLAEGPVLHAQEMIAYQDYGQGSHKQKRYDAINQRLLARFGGNVPPTSVFIKRGSTGVARAITNEDALIEALVARNWTILDIATASVAEMQRVLLGASVVVSIEGSQLDHAILAMPRGAAMVILVPQDRFLLRFVGLCRARGVRTGFVVIEGRLSDGYRTDLDEILRTVDLAQARP